MAEYHLTGPLSDKDVEQLKIGDTVYISLMSQYTPMPGMPAPLDRPVTQAEYDELVDYAIKKGVTNAFIQDASSAAESFIPPFDSTGV